MRHGGIALSLVIACAGPASGASCPDLAKLSLPQAKIESAAPVIPPFTAGDQSAFGAVTVQHPFCRVTGTIAPAIRFEVWLPVAPEWNGKLQGVGNGGVAGLINYASLGAAVDRGYAAVSSDLGHKGGFIDFRFAVGHPELVKDWGYRATHAMTEKAKAIVQAFYGTAPAHSYFTGCSGGGRQGLMEAQRYPGDYDGIVAGDPTSDFTRLTLGGRLWIAEATLKDPASYIPAAKIPALAAAVLAACDAQDGIKDGIVADPRQCRFDPATIQCKGADSDSCLTAAQVAAVKKIYAGSTNAKGERIFPGYMPGGELGSGGWASYMSGATPKQGGQFQYADGFARYMVNEKPDYDSLSFDFDRDMPAAIAKLSRDIDATNADLSAFAARGGKLIQYHGWSDPGVSPLSSIRYYESVVRAHDPSTSGRPSLKAWHATWDFYRLFMVPGMQHCVGGPGPDQFDALAALEAWVEKKIPPDRIIATHLTDGKPDRTRPLCYYPNAAQWTGQGSTDDARNFVCVSGR
jgi:feruloyl esterase